MRRGAAGVGLGASLVLALAVGGCLWRHGSIPARTLGGDEVDLLAGDVAAAVVVFVAPDCPISNRYVPELNRLHGRFAEQGVALWVAYPDAAFERDRMREHHRRFSIAAPALDDREQLLVRRAGVEVTPEAAVFDGAGRLRYRGRIDDWYVDFGRSRPRPTERSLERAVEALLAGDPVSLPEGRAVGCYIPSVDGVG